MFTEGHQASSRGVGAGFREDALVDDELGLYTIAAVGGDAGGRTAQVLVDAVGGAVEAEQSALLAASTALGGERVLQEVLGAAMAHASRAARDATRANGVLPWTCTALLVVGDRSAIAQVGPIRVDLVRDERLHRLTRDRPLAGGFALDPAIETAPLWVARGDRLVLSSPSCWAAEGADERVTAVLQKRRARAIPGAVLEDVTGADDATVIAVRVGGEPDRPRLHELRRRALGKIDQLPLFSGMPLRQRHRVLQLGALDTWGTEEEILAIGAPLDSLMVVVTGSLSIRAPGEHTRLREGEVAGWSRLLGPAPARATVRARGRATVLTVDAARFRRLARWRPWLGGPVLRRAARMARELRDPL